MKIETAFKETITLWSAMAESGQTKIEEVVDNPTFVDIQRYSGYCPMCEYCTQRNDLFSETQVCSHCFDWDSGTDVRTRMRKQIEVYTNTNTNNKLIFPEFPIPDHKGCVSALSPYYAWDFFTDMLVKSGCLYFDDQTPDQQTAVIFLRKQMRYWAGEVAVLVSKRYEEWKEEQNG